MYYVSILSLKCSGFRLFHHELTPTATSLMSVVTLSSRSSSPTPYVHSHLFSTPFLWGPISGFQYHIWHILSLVPSAVARLPLTSHLLSTYKQMHSSFISFSLMTICFPILSFACKFHDTFFNSLLILRWLNVPHLFSVFLLKRIYRALNFWRFCVAQQWK